MRYKVKSSNGELLLDENGYVLEQRTTPECAKVVRFDLEEYEKVWGRKPPQVIDILDVRGILEDGRELVWHDYKVQRDVMPYGTV